VLPIVAGILVGRLADSVLGTQPYATILLFGLGIGFGLMEAIRTMAAALEMIRHE